MKVTIESTRQMVESSAPAGAPRAIGRVWTGTTESGIPVQLLVSRIAVLSTERQEEFERELTAQHAPRPNSQAFPLRMVL